MSGRHLQPSGSRHLDLTTRGCTPGNSTALFHKGGISNGTADHIDTQKIFQIKFEKKINATNEESSHGVSDHKIQSTNLDARQVIDMETYCDESEKQNVTTV